MSKPHSDRYIPGETEIRYKLFILCITRSRWSARSRPLSRTGTVLRKACRQAMPVHRTGC